LFFVDLLMLTRLIVKSEKFWLIVSASCWHASATNQQINASTDQLLKEVDLFFVYLLILARLIVKSEKF